VTQPAPVDFRFGRAWIHAGREFQAGDVAQFAPPTATMLAELGAGSRVEQRKPTRRAVEDADGHANAIGDSQ
jgi:hypothetical protein